MKPIEKVINHINAFDKIIYFNTIEEEDFYKKIRKFCDENQFYFYEWDYASGLSGTDIYSLSVDQNTIRNPENALEFVNRRSANLKNKSIFIFRDLHFFLNEEKYDQSTIGTIAELKKFALMEQEEEKSCIILISTKFILPKELSQYVTYIESTYTDVDIENAVNKFKEDYKLILGENTYTKEWSNIKTLLSGLTSVEIDRTLRNAIIELEKKKNEDSITILKNYITDEKKKIIKASGVAELVEDETNIEDVGGLEELINFLKKKKVILEKFSQAKDLKIHAPKGCLIVGMPGCGKSLTAKAAHTLFGYPLLRLDIGMILGKYVGESEKNLRDMLNLAEAISPCVLWVDELEKAFAGSDSNAQNSDVMRRLMGYFLTWLQEKKTKTFVIATANSVDSIPEELLRKGRFDQLFYVEYPTHEERISIFSKHIKKMNLSFDLDDNTLNTKRETEYKDEIATFKNNFRADKRASIHYHNSTNGYDSTHKALYIKKDDVKEQKIQSACENEIIRDVCKDEYMNNFSGADIEGIIHEAAEDAFYKQSQIINVRSNIKITAGSISKIVNNMNKGVNQKKAYTEKINHLIELGFKNASKNTKS